MGWRSSGARAVESAAADRLARLARQWMPGSAAVPWQPPAATTEDTVAPDPWQAALGPDSAHVSVRAWNGNAIRALLVLIAACLAVTGWWWWSGRPSEVVPAPVTIATGTPIQGSAAPSIGAAPTAASTEIVVDVAGLVAQPGLVTLPAGSRVADAIAAAGGLTRRRAAESVNLARVLVDGEQIVVDGESRATSSTPTGPPLVDLNAADGPALEGLPGIGPVTSGLIIAWRQANGPFRSVDELGEVSGIGDATLARLRPLVRV